MELSSRGKLLGPMIVGLGGFVVLAMLGAWQIQRLGWKQGIIAEAERRIAAEPQALPVDLDPARDDYMPVFVTGTFDNDAEAFFLTSKQPFGPGFDIITPFETTDGRRILVDRGYVPQDERDPDTRSGENFEGEIRVEGVLRWPDDVNSFTPDPDLATRTWFSRDVDSLSGGLDTLPIFLIEAPTDRGGFPRGEKVEVLVRNQHLEYALTWFATALAWLVMTFLWARRQRAAPSQD